MPRFVLPLSEIDKEDYSLVGSEAANLGELSKHGIPVPESFVLTNESFSHFLTTSDLDKKLPTILSPNAKKAPTKDDVTTLIKKAFELIPVPTDLAKELKPAFKKLSTKSRLVSIFPSFSIDPPKYKREALVSSNNERDFLNAVRECWATSLNPTQPLKGVSLIIQPFFEKEVSGTLFTVDPETERKLSLIFAVWGLRGKNPTDLYEIEKSETKILKKEISNQETQLIKVGKVTKEVGVGKLYSKQQKLPDKKIEELSRLGKKIESFYGFPQQIEWEYESGKIRITSTRKLESIVGSKEHISHHRNMLNDLSFAETLPVEDVPRKTATKILTPTNRRKLAGDLAKQNVDGTIIWPEDFFAEIGTHPQRLIDQKKQGDLVSKLSNSLSQVAQAFEPRGVFYKASDLTSPIFRNLKFGEKYESVEKNPLLGLRGASKHLANSQIFQAELEAIKIARNKSGYRNISLVVPFVRTVKELVEIKRLIALGGLYQSNTFKIYAHLETPGSVAIIEKILDLGIDGIFIDIDGFSSLLLGLDRENEKLSAEFDELDESVLWGLEKIITATRKRSLFAGVWGQGVSIYPELVEKLVQWGVSCLVAGPEEIDKTRELVREAERKTVATRSN